MISGARYHRVATYSVMNPVSVPDGSAVFTLRASPKSQTFKSLRTCQPEPAARGAQGFGHTSSR
jgi:hypothetical protein